ncbi:hypothetical protein BGZ60DRAFT_368598 [Tricladium varicosporioides]|nr:hypothetical protein BGZ60DRAFT_368598 [Hymenoscyphus varicosporioides]
MKTIRRYHAPPDAYYRMEAADEKRHLDYNGKYYEGSEGSTGVVARWNMNTTEETFSVYIKKTGKDGEYTLVKVNFINEEAVKKFYTKFKSIITTNLIHGGFRGGAFAELVKPNAPIYDILWVVHSSPLLSRDMKAFWSKVPIAIHNKIRSYAVSESDRYFIDEQWFDLHFSEQMNYLRNFFHNERYYPTPLPNDISNAWLNELGTKFSNNYALALKGQGTFEVEKPFHVKKEWKFFNYKAEWEVKKITPGSNAPNSPTKTGHGKPRSVPHKLQPCLTSP